MLGSNEESDPEISILGFQSVCLVQDLNLMYGMASLERPLPTYDVSDDLGKVKHAKNVQSIFREDLNHIFELLAFNRQYEMFIRKLLSDVEVMLSNAMKYVDGLRLVLEDLHTVMQYKAAVPVMTVFVSLQLVFQLYHLKLVTHCLLRPYHK